MEPGVVTPRLVLASSFRGRRIREMRLTLANGGNPNFTMG
jgi:hypothetical protein